MIMSKVIRRLLGLSLLMLCNNLDAGNGAAGDDFVRDELTTICHEPFTVQHGEYLLLLEIKPLIPFRLEGRPHAHYYSLPVPQSFSLPESRRRCSFQVFVLKRTLQLILCLQ